jgi:protein-ribulosamine 3-kinase
VAPLDAISAALAAALGEPFHAQAAHGVGGGCIHRALVVEDRGRRFFVKLNELRAAPMFEAEADGLRALAATGAIRVPDVVTCGAAGGEAFLVLEYVDLSGRGDSRALGRALARLHRSVGPHFGWPWDNYIGATPQLNGMEDEWPAFYARRRLQPQLQRARSKGCSTRLYDDGMTLSELAGRFFADYRPAPSLLHGDLWGGNAAFLADGTPVIFDPAVYWGDREADLAMTELFGGFGSAFYAAYREAWPLAPGYGIRKELYNLYHILNHFNLFGGGYGDQAQRMVGRLLAQLRA